MQIMCMLFTFARSIYFVNSSSLFLLYFNVLLCVFFRRTLKTLLLFSNHQLPKERKLNHKMGELVKQVGCCGLQSCQTIILVMVVLVDS